MRKFYLFVVMALVALVSCETANTPSEPATLTLTSEAVLNFAAEGGQGVVTYTLANVKEGELPVAESGAEWISNIAVGETIFRARVHDIITNCADK